MPPTAAGPLLSNPQVVAAIITGGATFVSAILVGVVGTLLTRWFSRARDRQDRESQWRSHAVELTKLEVQRKLEAFKTGGQPLRPTILDFLANYRDLQELGETTPKDLYLKILKDRVCLPEASPSTRVDDSKPVVGTPDE